MAQQFQEHQQAQVVDLTRRTYAQYTKPRSRSGLYETVAEVLDQAPRDLDDEAMVLLTDVPLNSFLTGQAQCRDKNLVEGRLQAVCIAIANCKCAGAGLVQLKQHAVVVVIVVAAAGSAK